MLSYGKQSGLEKKVIQMDYAEHGKNLVVCYNFLSCLIEWFLINCVRNVKLDGKQLETKKESLEILKILSEIGEN